MLAGHAGMASGLRDAAKLILGERDDLLAAAPFTGDLEALTAEVEAVAVEQGTGALFVLTDIQGGSPFNALHRLTRKPNVRLLTGMNLPLVLSLALALDQLDASSPLDGLLAESRDAIAERTVSEGAASEEEDFS